MSSRIRRHAPAEGDFLSKRAALAPFVPHLLRQAGRDHPQHWASQGTMLFADVSGFTRLTEKLSRRGKIGAEEMVGAISLVWTALLTASLNGGDTIKFGGDALLVFYDGDDHATRAAGAALAMQRALRNVGRIQTDGGVVRLRMSVGLHSGEFQFMLCGDSHLELHVLGEAATTTVQVEDSAGPDQVVASSATAHLLEGARTQALDGDRMLIKSVGASLADAKPTGKARAELERFIPQPLRGRIEKIEHEHRPATVAFVAFGSVDRLLREAGSDETFDRVQSLTVEVMKALAEYEVLMTATDIGLDGGKFMLTAGTPDATGDEEARMLRVARRIVETDCGLPTRVGVHSGHVFVGPVGAPFRRTYSAMGDTTNLAARLSSKAPWGGVLASESSLAAVRGRFRTQDVPPFHVKGKTAPISAALVTGTEITRDRETADAALVGRDEEIAALGKAIESARSGTGVVLEIVGPEGVGKSRLVEEVRHRVDTEMTWVSAVCERFEQPSPYSCARLLLRRALGIASTATPSEAGRALTTLVETHRPDLSPWIPLMAVPVGADVAATREADEIAPEFLPGRLRQATVEFLETLADQPAVLAIEEAGFMDGPSAELVAELLRVVWRHPWLVVYTRRDTPEGLHPGLGYPAEAIALQPLDPSETLELAKRLAERQPVPSHLLADLAERSGGNPMFLTELIAAAQSDDHGDLPRSLEALVATRLDRLSPDRRRLIRELSVLGERFEPTLAKAVFEGTEIDWRDLDGVIEEGEERLAFSNPLVCQVAYEGLTFRRRRELHGRVADALAATAAPRPELLAHHYVRAERWEEAWRWARLAADEALESGANASAGQLLELALTAASRFAVPSSDMRDVALAAGEALEKAGLWQRAQEAYAKASTLIEDIEGQLLLASRRARVHAGMSRYPQALRLYTSAMKRAEMLPPSETKPALLAELHNGYAATKYRQGRFDEAIRHGVLAGELAASAEAPRIQAEAAHLLDRAHGAIGDVEGALRYRDSALTLFALLGDLPAQGTVLHDLAFEAHRNGRLDEAMWLYERSREVRERAGDVVGAAITTNSIGEVLLDQGQLEGAEARFTEALRAWRGARDPQGVAQAEFNLGRAALASSRLDDSLARLEEAERLAADIGAEGLLFATRLALAAVLIEQGRHVEAWETATLVLEASTDPSDEVAARELRSRALISTGSLLKGEAELEKARALADRSAAPSQPMSAAASSS